MQTAPASQQASKPASQQASKPASQQASKPASQSARAPGLLIAQLLYDSREPALRGFTSA
jgi:hypothetical protein